MIKTDYYCKGEVFILDMALCGNIGNEDGMICDDKKEVIIFDNENAAKKYLKKNIPFSERCDRFLFVPANHSIEYSEN